jgi:hypothetical protein
VIPALAQDWGVGCTVDRSGRLIKACEVGGV